MARYAMSKCMCNVLAVLCAMLAIVGCAIHTPKLPDTLTAPDPNSFHSPVYVTVRLEGQAVPGRPAIAPFENEIEVLHYTTRNFYPQPVGQNKWTCALEKDRRYAVGWISKKMQGYHSQSFAATEGLEVVISPGMPLAIECDFTDPPKQVKIFPAKVYIEVPVISDGKETTTVIKSVDVKRPSIARIGGLAAGRYKLLIVQNERENWWRPYLNSHQLVELEAGKTNRFVPIYPNIDTTVEPGDVIIKGTVLDKDKKPAAGKEVFLRPTTISKQILSNLFYPAAVIANDGSFEFKGVNPAYSYSIMSENTQVGIEKPEPNSVSVIDIYLGMTELSAKPGTRPQPLTIQWLDETTSNIGDYAGKTVVIDFWASWCSPCWRSLPQLNKIAARYQSRQDVIFIAVSIDIQHKEWQKAVEEINCKSLRHGWLNGKLNRFSPNTGVPYCIIINKDGTIAAEGHEIDAEAELSKLLVPELSARQ